MKEEEVKYNYLNMDERIEKVNEIIKEMSSRGRMFFLYKNKVAIVFKENNDLYFKDPYNDFEIKINTKYNRKPCKFTSGGTLWGLINDFKDYILTGNYSNGNNGYAGLYCPHWGYSEEDMEIIRAKAKSLGYL